MDKPLNIAFTLPETVSRSAISLSNHIRSSDKVKFTLSNKTNIPHITVYQLIIPGRNLEYLIKIIADLVSDLAPQKFKFRGFEANSGYISTLLQASEAVELFQKQAVNSLNFLREGMNLIGREDPSFKSYPEKQRKNIIQYGFDNLLDFYNPHITITCLSEPGEAENLAKNLSWSEKEFYCSGIGVYSLGEFGTCKKLIKEFKLKAGD